MICENCSNEVPEGSTFCNKCGAKIIEEPATETEVMPIEIEPKDNNAAEEKPVINKRMTKRTKIIFVFILSIVALIGGFYVYNRTSKPKNVSEKIYNQTLNYINVIENAEKQNKNLGDSASKEIVEYVQQNSKNANITKEEKDILESLFNTAFAYTFYIFNSNDNTKKDYDKYMSQLKALMKLDAGKKYQSQITPKETKKSEYKDNFSYLKISNTSVNKGNINSELTGTITNTGNKTLDGYFSAIFYNSNGSIVKTYMTKIPGNSIAPGETKVFSILINKFDYSRYDFQGETIIEK